MPRTAPRGSAASRRRGRRARLMREAVDDVAPVVLQWFGPDSERARALQEASITSSNGSGMRTQFIERAAPLLRLVAAHDGFASLEPDFSSFDEASRRPAGTTPDERTIAQVRGDRNRAFLMD
jgi:hypothetical protein